MKQKFLGWWKSDMTWGNSNSDAEKVGTYTGCKGWLCRMFSSWDTANTCRISKTPLMIKKKLMPNYRWKKEEMFVFLPKFYTEKSRVCGMMATELTLIQKQKLLPLLCRLCRHWRGSFVSMTQHVTGEPAASAASSEHTLHFTNKTDAHADTL